MSSILVQYQQVEPTTWVYLSSLLTIALFFKFSRIWSVRNLDLLALIFMAPGMLAVVYGQNRGAPHIAQLGYGWLFAMSGLFLVRLLLDPLMVRRPLLEPNLSVGGMTFLGISLLVFLMANIVNSPVDTSDVSPRGPGYPLLSSVPQVTTQIIFPKQDAVTTSAGAAAQHNEIAEATARTMAILGHIAVVAGMIVIGLRHFDNIRTGIGAATLYLLMPYTAQTTGHVDHVLPAALLVWAIQFYRQPLLAGMLIGVATGTIFYPLFLLPLWIGFYWQRGLTRFLGGFGTSIAVLVLILVATSSNFWVDLGQMFGATEFSRSMTDVAYEGFWKATYVDAVYRWPVIAAFLCLSTALAIWPAQKNLGTLLSCSAAVMLGTQFWHAERGGTYMAWYLPVLLLTVFRPNLEDRVALSVLGEGWKGRRRAAVAGERAA